MPHRSKGRTATRQLSRREAVSLLVDAYRTQPNGGLSADHKMALMLPRKQWKAVLTALAPIADQHIDDNDGHHWSPT